MPVTILIQITDLYKIASTFLLAILFLDTGYSQGLKFYPVGEVCSSSDYYLEINKAHKFYIDGESKDLNEDHIKSYKVSGKKINVEQPKPNQYGFSVTPVQIGKFELMAKIKLTDGRKIMIRQEYEVVKLPDLKLELFSSNPDHNFIWFKLVEMNTGKDVSNDYSICMLDYELLTSDGKRKQGGVIVSNTYFPSISLDEFASKFELNDTLIISLRVIHKKYHLVKELPSSSLIITRLWN